MLGKVLEEGMLPREVNKEQMLDEFVVPRDVRPRLIWVRPLSFLTSSSH